MRTTKPISTISYNTTQYLIDRLDDLVKAGKITAWFFIEHQPEEDETKAHKHLYIELTKLIQTEDLRKEFIEPTPTSSKPLGCMPFQSSKFDDWYLYGLHDSAYLATKGETRGIEYSHADFVSSDEDYFDELARKVKRETGGIFRRIKEAVELGMSWTQLASSGRIPLNLINQSREVYNSLRSEHITRGKKSSHEHELPKVSRDRGEREMARYARKVEYEDVSEEDELPL